MLAGLKGSDGAAVSGKTQDSFHSGIVRACWPRKLPIASPHAVLSLLDALDGCDAAFFCHLGAFLGRCGGTLATVLERFGGFTDCWVWWLQEARARTVSFAG